MCFDLPDLMQLFPLHFRFGAHFLSLSRETWSSPGRPPSLPALGIRDHVCVGLSEKREMGKGGRQHRGWHSEHAQGVLVAVTDGLGSCRGDGRSHREEWRCGNAAEQGEQVQLVRPRLTSELWR